MERLSPSRAWRGAALLVLGTLALVVLALSDSAHAVLESVLVASQSVIGRHQVLGAILFMALAALSAMLAFASVALLLPLAVFTWGEPLSILLLWVGWLLGGVFTYGVGRFFGRRAARWAAAESLLHRLERHVGPATPFGV